MKNLTLRLKGFKGIQYGMGLQQVSLDISDISGLIAMSGPNGLGKTTILDNFQPYRIMPSRKRALIHQVLLRDSEKEYTFSFNGDHFKTLLKIDAESGRSEGYIWLNHADNSMVDGKVVNYDSAIKEIFGSQELFVNSVFCAQGSKKLNQMRKGELQALFAEFLRIYKYQEWEKTTGTGYTIYTSRAEKYSKKLEDLKKLIDQKETVQESGLTLTWQKDKLIKDLSSAKTAKTAAEDELYALQKAVEKNKIIDDKIKDFEAQGLKLSDEYVKFTQDMKAELTRLSTKKTNKETDIISLESMLANEQEIRKAAVRVKELDKSIETLNPKINESYDECAKKNNAFLEKEKTLNEFNTKENEALTDQRVKITVLENQVKNMEKLAAGIDARDPKCTSTTCSLIVDALEAGKQLPELNKKLDTERDALMEMEQGIDAKRQDLQLDLDLSKSEHEVSVKIHGDLNSQKLEAENELKKIKGLASELSAVEVAAAKKEDLKKQIKEIAEEIDNREKYWNNLLTGKLDDMKGIENQINDLKKEITENVELKFPEIKTKIQNYNKLVNQIVDSQIPAIEVKLRQTLKDLEEITEAEKQHKELTELKKASILEATDWSYLKTVCGKDGIQNLEINSVAPVVCGYANDLLLSTFGPGHSVKILTQDEETLKEIFDILVIEPDGSETYLDDKSGGERVWILKALRLALTLISKEKSGVNYQSAMADEEDGALDVENAKRFVHLYRSFMTEGAFQDCIYISHKLEAVALADHIINYQKGGITIE